MRDMATSRAVVAIAVGVALLHLATSGVYGVFRDEFYYLACAEHLDWGYVDHPPFSIALLGLVRALLGDSIFALRLLPSLAGAVLVLISALLARALGGGRFAQLLAALAVAIAPINLALTGIYSMNAFDVLFWALLALVVVHLSKEGDPRWWLAFGALVGLGLLNKYSVLFFAAGIAIAVPLTPLRRHLRTPYPWLGALMAAVLFAPHVIWQVRHGWPTLEFIHNAQQHKIAPLSPLAFLLAQVEQVHPLNAPLWLAGLGVLLFGREERRFRCLGIAYLTALTLMVVQRAKPYYLSPAYPMLLAAGAGAVERWLAGFRVSWPRPALLLVLAAGGALSAPFVVPLLPVDTFIAYQRTLGQAPRTDERHGMGPLPQFFADRFGWEEMTRAVASAYASLPPEDRARAVIVTSNYGEAGALNYFGPSYGLPRAVSQHNNFFLWGPGTDRADVVITVGMSPEDVQDSFESQTIAGRIVAPYAMPYETRNPILVCRDLKLPVAEAWARGKSFI